MNEGNNVVQHRQVNVCSGWDRQGSLVVSSFPACFLGVDSNPCHIDPPGVHKWLQLNVGPPKHNAQPWFPVLPSPQEGLSLR